MQNPDFHQARELGRSAVAHARLRRGYIHELSARHADDAARRAASRRAAALRTPPPRPRPAVDGPGRAAGV